LQSIIDLTKSKNYKEKVAGLSIVKRHLFCLEKVGIKNIFIILSDKSFVEKELKNKKLLNLDIEFVAAKEELKGKLNQDVLVIEEDVIYDPELIIRLSSAGESTSYKGAKLSFIPKESVSDYFEGKQLDEFSAENIFLRRIENRSDIKNVEKDMVRALRTSGDTFISRTINRPVSLFVTSIIMHFKITPNMITTFNLLLGLAGVAAIWIIPGYFKALTAGLLFHISSVLDGCDGEIARLKFQGSEFGAKFDDFSDDFTNFLFYSSAAIYTSVFWITDNITWICTGIGIFGYVAGKILQTFIIKKEHITNVKHQTFYFEKRSENFGKNPFMWVYKIARHVVRNDFLALLALIAGIFSVYWLAPYVIFGFGGGLVVSMTLEIINQNKKAKA
jgi:phosphatidylglycerophosphate synthase